MLGEAATHLAWLSPSAASLVALARSPTATIWRQVRGDPGAVLLLLRQVPDQAVASSQSFSGIHEPAVLLEAARLLETPGPSYVDWNEPSVRPIYHACHTFARIASRLSERTGRADPDNAWAAGLLAPLGWLAAAAVSPEQTAACLADAGRISNPSYTPSSLQQKHWGIDHAGIARRLARRWHLPRWLLAIAGHLDLRVETAQILGADPDLFRLAQLAVALVQRQSITLHLSVGGYPEELAAALGLSSADLTAIEHEIHEPGASATGVAEIKATEITENMEKTPTLLGDLCALGGSGTYYSSLITHHSSLLPPAQLPLLRDLLILAAENRRLGDAPVNEELERDLDQLHRAFQEQSTAEEQRLHARKLEALAEFSAGAGHEINNPLAVISGQAQYLLHHEPDAAKQKALQTIVGQTQRIHQLLNEMMQFARPSPPVMEPVNLSELLNEVTAAQADLATLRSVRLICPQPPALPVRIDPRHLKTVLSCLLRNAIEAAPTDGWAGVRIEESETGQESGGRGQRTDVRNQRSEVGGQESGIKNQESAISSWNYSAVRGSPDPALAPDRRSPESPETVPVGSTAGSGDPRQSLPAHSSPITHHSSLSSIDFIIEDSGPGIAPHQREHMFDPFYSGRQAGRGHGLGLPIAWRLARQIGGDVRFEDIPNGPTRFVLSLPLEMVTSVASTSIVTPQDCPAAA
jgi:signal transduction histidine kinase